MVHTDAFDDLVGSEVIELIISRGPTKVLTRFGKSIDHFTKAAQLEEIDEEMGIIRLIAAEEELVVAIFEWLKLNSQHLPDHSDFIGKQKNHLVKLSFVPVLQQLSYVLSPMLHHGLTVEGLEDVLHWNAQPILRGGRVVVEIRNNDGAHILDVNPLDVAVSLKDESSELVTQQLFHDFCNHVKTATGNTVKQFIAVRADYRNKILYASDGGTFSMGDKQSDLVRDVFSPSLRLLIWVLATLLTNRPSTKQWGVVNQFISLYRLVLTEAKLI